MNKCQRYTGGRGEGWRGQVVKILIPIFLEIKTTVLYELYNKKKVFSLLILLLKYLLQFFFKWFSLILFKFLCVCNLLTLSVNENLNAWGWEIYQKSILHWALALPVWLPGLYSLMALDGPMQNHIYNLLLIWWNRLAK